MAGQLQCGIKDAHARKCLPRPRRLRTRLYPIYIELGRVSVDSVVVHAVFSHFPSGNFIGSLLALVAEWLESSCTKVQSIMRMRVLRWTTVVNEGSGGFLQRSGFRGNPTIILTSVA